MPRKCHRCETHLSDLSGRCSFPRYSPQFIHLTKCLSYHGSDCSWQITNSTRDEIFGPLKSCNQPINHNQFLTNASMQAPAAASIVSLFENLGPPSFISIISFNSVSIQLINITDRETNKLMPNASTIQTPQDLRSACTDKPPTLRIIQ